jgi:hypothetical protein
MKLENNNNNNKILRWSDDHPKERKVEKFKNPANLALSKFGNFRLFFPSKSGNFGHFSQKNPSVECALPFFSFPSQVAKFHPE